MGRGAKLVKRHWLQPNGVVGSIPTLSTNKKSMKAIIGQFYKTEAGALKRAEQLKVVNKGKKCFVVIGNEKKGFMVVSEKSARACGLDIPYNQRSYQLNLI